MASELTCNQVIALLSFYAEDKLNPTLKESIDRHLKKCAKCRELYKQSEKITNLINERVFNEVYETKQYKNFRHNLSAYIDNELDGHENLKIKKIAITNPMARKDMEEIYNLKRLMHNSFDRIKSDMKYDYSKSVMSKILSTEPKADPFFKIVSVFSGMIAVIIIGFLAILYS